MAVGGTVLHLSNELGEHDVSTIVITIINIIHLADSITTDMNAGQ